MAKRYSMEEVFELLTHSLTLEEPSLNRGGVEPYIPMTIIVKDGRVLGLLIAEKGEDIGELEWEAGRATPK